MAGALYCIQVGTPLTDDPTDPIRERAAALGCGVGVGDASNGLITAWPSVVVLGNYTPPAVFPDNTGQATLSEVSTALATATNAENQAAQVKTNIYANVTNRQNTIKAWIAANPNGAVLNAAQTLVLAEMLDGLCDILLAEFGSSAGT